VPNRDRRRTLALLGVGVVATDTEELMSGRVGVNRVGVGRVGIGGVGGVDRRLSDFVVEIASAPIVAVDWCGRSSTATGASRDGFVPALRRLAIPFG
jgi:hypothetical protein